MATNMAVRAKPKNYGPEAVKTGDKCFTKQTKQGPGCAECYQEFYALLSIIVPHGDITMYHFVHVAVI
jgi:hypothetical protein